MKKLLLAITIICMGMMASCGSTSKVVDENGLVYAKDSLSKREMASWIKKNESKCAQLIQGHMAGYDITSQMRNEQPCLVYLVLNAKSLKNHEEKQNWFDLFPFMNEEHIYKLYKILYKEKHILPANQLNQEAYDFAKNKNYDEALNTIDKAIKKFPNDANLYDSKGEILLMKGDTNGALKMWNKAMKKDPNYFNKHGETELYKGLKKLNLIK